MKRLMLALAFAFSLAAPLYAAPDPFLAQLNAEEKKMHEKVKKDPAAEKKFIATRKFLRKATPVKSAPKMTADVDFEYTLNQEERLLLFDVMIAQAGNSAFA